MSIGDHHFAKVRVCNCTLGPQLGRCCMDPAPTSYPYTTTQIRIAPEWRCLPADHDYHPHPSNDRRLYCRKCGDVKILDLGAE